MDVVEIFLGPEVSFPVFLLRILSAVALWSVAVTTESGAQSSVNEPNKCTLQMLRIMSTVLQLEPRFVYKFVA